jgi:hypothetical protein
MNGGSEYIKEIESYFLTLAGEGIMLSSFDYSLIQDWKKRGIPKEIVYKGISRAFKEKRGNKKNGSGTPRSLRHCARHVENCIEEYMPIIKGLGRGHDKIEEHGDTERDAAERIERFIREEKNPPVREYYVKLRKKVLRLDKEAGNYISSVSVIEAESLEDFFSGLPEKDREKISIEAEEMIKERARFMTRGAYDESLSSFRNEIVVRKYGIKCIIS